jgi:hypothetical protein
VRGKTKQQREQAMELAVLIRDFHRSKRHLLKCRLAYTITADAIELVFPKPPAAKARGVRETRRVST